MHNKLHLNWNWIGEDDLEAGEVDHKLSESQIFALYKDLEGYRSLWDTSYVKNTPLLSLGNPLSHVNFSTSFSTPFLIFTEQKAQTKRGKHSLPTKKELSSCHLWLHTTDQSYAQDLANLQYYILLQDKFVTHLVIHATKGFNLQCNNVAKQGEGKCCLYYRPLYFLFHKTFSLKIKIKGLHMVMVMEICSGTSTEWLFIHWNPDRIGIWKCWILGRGETRRKTSQSREENQQQTQPTYGVNSRNRSQAT